MKTLSQQEVWDKIGGPWQKFRKRAPLEVVEFLSKKKGKILDMGCGSGRNILKIKRARYYCVDFSAEMLKFAEKTAKKEKILADFFRLDFGKENLPFKDNFFDSAIFISTLHCIEGENERKKALKELYRVLKKGKEAMITVWNKEQNELAKKLNAREGFVNWKKDNINYQRYYYFYNKKELENLLKNIGFKVVKYSSYAEKHSKRNIIVYVKK